MISEIFKRIIKKNSFLVTGGSGFIGSNLVDFLIKNNAKKVRVLDNLSNGYFKNIEKFISCKNFEFIEGDIRNLKTCEMAFDDIDYCSHQAALGSVPRSIENPILSNDVNVSGFLNILNSAKNSKKLKKLVYAASSSTYGDKPDLPKIEGHEGKPLSPYAVTKAVNEMYADVFFNIYGLSSIGLRYFNVFGPNQNPKNPYAAVIPIFLNKIYNDESPIIFGDGKTSRDFTYVDNAVYANILALFSNKVGNSVYNVACGERISLNQIIENILRYTNKKIEVKYADERSGDIKHSLASLKKIKKELNYEPKVYFNEGLIKTYNWIENNYEKK